MPGTMRPASSISAMAVRTLAPVAIHARGCIRRRAATASSAEVTSASATAAADGAEELEPGGRLEEERIGDDQRREAVHAGAQRLAGPGGAIGHRDPGGGVGEAERHAEPVRHGARVGQGPEHEGAGQHQQGPAAVGEGGADQAERGIGRGPLLAARAAPRRAGTAWRAGGRRGRPSGLQRGQPIAEAGHLLRERRHLRFEFRRAVRHDVPLPRAEKSPACAAEHTRQGVAAGMFAATGPTQRGEPRRRPPGNPLFMRYSARSGEAGARGTSARFSGRTIWGTA